jgi:hypothetical protein
LKFFETGHVLKIKKLEKIIHKKSFFGLQKCHWSLFQSNGGYYNGIETIPME